jgi:CheY-like chemotaxis protein
MRGGVARTVKTVLDVGNCPPDRRTLANWLGLHFGCHVIHCEAAREALEILRQQAVDLVLVNRKLDIDYSDGLKVIEQIKADAALANVPVMLVSNYPEHQHLAMQAGALEGFGKLQLELPASVEKVAAVLGDASPKVAP